jgi:hypothetical protein
MTVTLIVSACRYCLAYCYLNLIEEELKDFIIEWNSHYIRRVHGSRCPAGVPTDLFGLPQITGIITFVVAII